LASSSHTRADLNKKAIGGLLFLLIVVAALLFVPAGTIHYWQAWIFLAVFAVSVFGLTLDLMKNDPELLQRRMHSGPRAERRKSQKIIQSISTIATITVIVFSVIDHRLGWSAVPPYVAIAGDGLVALGFLMILFVFRQNTFAASIIEVVPEQKVVSTGLYAIVRHPMYAGILVSFLGVPLALGSWSRACRAIQNIGIMCDTAWREIVPHREPLVW
jgi:hypothetical protein